MGCRGRQPLQMIPYMYGFTRAAERRPYKLTAFGRIISAATGIIMQNRRIIPLR